MPENLSGTTGDGEELKEGEDYYWDGPYMVFTETYHLRRGECCNSGCRHCPYREPGDEPST